MAAVILSGLVSNKTKCSQISWLHTHGKPIPNGVWRERKLTDYGSSLSKHMFESAASSIANKLGLKMDLGGLKLKLHKVHLSNVLQSQACEGEDDLTAKCPECSFNLMSSKIIPSTPR